MIVSNHSWDARTYNKVFKQSAVRLGSEAD
jgi:hypothetical protein